MAELVVQPPIVQRRGPLEIVVDRVWRFFCSVRAAIWEVAIVAVLVLIGTLRGSSVPRWIDELVPGTSWFVERWYAWDVYKSLPFAFMLGLNAVAITICTMNRAPGMWQSIAHPTVTTTHGFLRSADQQLHSTRTISRKELSTEIASALVTSRYRVLTEEAGGETHIYGDRYRYGKLGTFPFHLALIMILIGGIVGSRYGFRETSFVVAEGATKDVGHGTGLSVHLVNFEDTYTELGQPSEYSSHLVLLKDGQSVKEKTITLNDPLNYASTVFYQTSFGPAVALKVTDDAGNVLYEGSIPVGIANNGDSLTALGNSDAPAGELDLLSVGKKVFVITPDSNPANRPELDALRLRSGEIQIRMRDLISGDQTSAETGIVEIGKTSKIGNMNFTFVRESQWTLLQISRNPGIPIFWAAAFLIIGGLGIVFYFPHRRVRAIVTQLANGQSTAVMAPMAKRDWSARRSFEQLALRINGQTGDAWTLVARNGELQSTDAGSSVSTS